MTENISLKDHPEYWNGMEHTLFFRSLKSALSGGSKRFAEDTERRELWVQESMHYFPEMMLIGSFSYLEGQLGKNWVPKYGGRRKRELYVLRHIRNACVHTNGDLKALTPFRRNINARKGRPANIEVYVRRFASDLRRQKIRDDKGNVYPAFIEISRKGCVTLEQDAFMIVQALSNYVCSNAGLYSRTT